ncbi:siderophore-interacting protein [Arthrobacter sp. Sa2CUA1]|uniref:Siderophore-interacting protein n=1 Tax=Arthrobacter gallicola TaxID=2762225 RepID=A0ABR8UWW7_9MICC|nr:siderophore-interacting protein [Arthrobacter gallicola]MBD7996601.1 siderophore-interacting protein [Arthrobacter gallicola]
MPDVPAIRAEAPARRTRPAHTMQVLRREQLSPHMVRIVAGGEGFDTFEPNGRTDAYCKIWFGPDGRPLDGSVSLETLREQNERENWPVSRTYTVRWVDIVKRELAMDFVVHGADGIAGPWADSAQPGELITFGGPGGAFSPDPDADWYLFAADESALPATAAALETLDAAATGHVLIEVGGPADELALVAPAGMTVTWVHRGEAAPGALLTEAVGALAWRPGQVQVFAHGEREAMKSLREIFFTRHKLERGQVSLSGYWAAGRTEDAFQAEKRTPAGKVL